jgi:drug/metabolite transporter (DMT)-like permease
MFKNLKSSSSLAWSALIIGIICIGFSAIFVKLAWVPGSVSAFYRLLFAAMAIIPIWIYRGSKVPASRDVRLIAAGAVFFALDLFLWNTSILLTSAATATLLANNAPIWVGLISMLVLRQRLGHKFWIGVLIAMVGLYVLVGPGKWKEVSMNQGDILALIAGFFYALYIIYTMDVRKRVDTITFMTFSVVIMCVVLAVINIILGNAFTGYSWQSWGWLAAMGLISHFGGWIAINYALGHLKGHNVSATLLAQAVVTAIMGIIILGEYLDTAQVVGGVLVIAGVYVVNRGK